MALSEHAAALRSIYAAFLQHYGPQHWWPGESRFEVMVGAVLTQNTAWGNVEKAINHLKRVDCLQLDRLLALDEAELAELIRPAGYFNVKARRLKNLCRLVHEQGGESALAAHSTGALRKALLSVNGVGPETADDILLYAFDRPVFVIDAYTRRIFSRFGLISGDESYESLRLGIQAALGLNVEIFNEYHALIVHHAKYFCKPKPACEHCILSTDCKKMIN